MSLEIKKNGNRVGSTFVDHTDIADKQAVAYIIGLVMNKIAIMSKNIIVILFDLIDLIIYNIICNKGKI